MARRSSKPSIPEQLIEVPFEGSIEATAKVLDEEDIEKYITIMKNSINIDGYLVIGTFSENGPKKCSGLEIKQYSEMSMSTRLGNYFQKLKCITVDHMTPIDTIQNFLFCSFKRLNMK